MLSTLKSIVLISAVFFACTAQCSRSASSTQHGRFTDLKPGVKVLTANNKLVVPELTTREQDLEEAANSHVDWNVDLMRDAHHHSIVVQEDDRVYTMHWYETESANITNGDVLLTADYLDYLISHDGHTPPDVGLLGLAASSTRTRWPCPIPWSSDFGADRRITEAIAHIEEFTPWRFVQRTTQSDYMRFQASAGCSSFIGRIGGGQTVSLVNGCETAAAVHEIMHAIGIPHEQSRSDRDSHVRINFGVIQGGAERNFDIDTSGKLIGPYDFGSIMHYGVNDFTATGGAVITPLTSVPDTACFQIGQRVSVSEGDVGSMLDRYDGGGTCANTFGSWTPGSDVLEYTEFTPCTQAGSMRVCGGGNTYNGVYIPSSTVNGRTSYIRHPWTFADRFVYYDGSRWCLGQSTTRCSVAGSNTDTPDQSTWSSPYSVSSCDGGAPANPCENNPCNNGGTCNDLNNGDFTCSCTNEWAGETCDTSDNDCSPNPCQNGGQCRDTGDDYQCTCVNGYEGDECQTAPDPCEDNPCENGGTCSATGDTTFQCSCVGEWTGDTCDESTNSCFNEPCMNGGRCIDLDGDSFQCECPTEFRGGRCQVADNDCDPQPCLNGGVCTDTGIQSFECNCPQMYTGTTCATELEACANNPCLNGGICANLGDLASCVCTETWTGMLCEIPDDDCAQNPCQNGGRCTDTGLGEFECTCANGWEGATCTQSEDDCSPNPCANGGACIDGDQSFTCNCAAGFEGDVCQNNIDDCARNTCVNGQCIDGVNDYQCDCEPGFIGESCEQALNSCDPNPCENGGRCVQDNPADLPQCLCATGFTGTLCNIDQNDCLPNPCQNGGICEDIGINAYQCTCVPGFLGFLCDIRIGGDPLVAETTRPGGTSDAQLTASGGGGGGSTAAIGGGVGAVVVIGLVAGGVFMYKKKKNSAYGARGGSTYGGHQQNTFNRGMPSNANEDVVELSFSDERSPPMSTASGFSGGNSHAGGNRSFGGHQQSSPAAPPRGPGSHNGGFGRPVPTGRPQPGGFGRPVPTGRPQPGGFGRPAGQQQHWV